MAFTGAYIVEPRMNIYVKPHNDFAKYLIEIARKWQEKWIKDKIFEADAKPGKPKFFLTAAFPYPNGPSHMGHARTYTVTDVYARFKRMQGYNVLFPMGFHYTGTPVLAMAEAVAAKDEKLLNLFRKVYGIPDDIIPKLSDPLTMARYFHAISKISLIETGYSIDWRREFTTIDPEFKAFIRWQFEKLRQKGYLVKGTHPVGWCPKHNMPVGMHDTKDDVEPEIGEWTLIFFEDEDGIIYPAATLRPETVLGVTNIWVNPSADYVKVKVDDMEWIISDRAAYKLRFQRKRIEVIEKFKGEKLLGKRVRNPVTGERVVILPASFVDPDTGTGIVMSVPAHAPYDYAAIIDLDREVLSKYGVSLDELKPRPLIRVKGYGELPAVEVVERMKIKSQNEREKLEEATKEVYGAEYKYGVMREDVVKYVAQDLPDNVRRYLVGVVKAWIAGKPVSEARDNIARWLKESRYADVMYEIMNKPVYCRCGTEIVVKILEDQWFIDYGNPEWKEIVRKALSKIRIVPPEYREDFKYTIEWVQRRACARTRGLGTELPWAPGWIIESLSDSTIYMAYYTISHKIKEYKLRAEQLTYEFWDYVMLGKGDVKEVSKSTGIPVKVLEELRKEFDYWYPLDSRHSAKDLIPNHLTFFIYNHTAIFPEEKWPRQIAVNGWLLIRGHKMSKSLGNVIPLRIMNHLYGPDTVRATVILSSEVGQDADFTDELVESVLDKLKKFRDTIMELHKMYSKVKELNGTELTDIDKWILSRMQKHIKNITNAMENLRFREAANIAFYIIDKDVKRYLERVYDEINSSKRKKTIAWVLSYIVDVWIRLVAPIIPHLAEELWSSIGKQGYVSLAKWPEVKEEYISVDVEVKEEYVDRVINDIREIIKVTKTKPSRIILYVASKDSYEILRDAIRTVLNGKPLKEFMRQALSKVKDRKAFARIAKKYYDLASEIPPHLKDYLLENTLDEYQVLSNAKEYIARTIGAKEVIVYLSDDPSAPDIGGKKKMAIAFKPAIYIE